MKTFSVITPVYNGEKFIPKCISAIANTNYSLSKIEHIIVDDGSTDKTKAICQKFAKKHKHIHFYSKKNGNWGSVINFVKKNKLAHGEYIVVCDADDVILPNAFKTINEKNNNADFCAGSFYLWDGGNKKRKVHPYYFAFKRNLNKKREMNYYSPILLPHCSYLKKSLFYKTKKLQEFVSYQDNILYLDAFRKAKTIKYIPTPLSLYWQKRGGNTMSNILTPKGLKMQISNLNYYAAQNKIEPFFYVMIGMPKLRKHLTSKKMKFKFDKTRLDLTGFPFYVRPILRMMYSSAVKKLVKKNKS